MKSIMLRTGKERSLSHRHPWICESSIQNGRADAYKEINRLAFELLSEGACCSLFRVQGY